MGHSGLSGAVRAVHPPHPRAPAPPGVRCRNQTRRGRWPACFFRGTPETWGAAHKSGGRSGQHAQHVAWGIPGKQASMHSTLRGASPTLSLHGMVGGRGAADGSMMGVTPKPQESAPREPKRSRRMSDRALVRPNRGQTHRWHKHLYHITTPQQNLPGVRETQSKHNLSGVRASTMSHHGTPPPPNHDLPQPPAQPPVQSSQRPQTAHQSKSHTHPHSTQIVPMLS